MVKLILFYISGGAKCQKFLCEIIHVDQRSSISWEIPQFPVITSEFAFVQFKKNGQIHKGVIQKCELRTIQPGVFTCTSHCEIKIYGEKYTVLWKLVPGKSISDENGGNNPEIEFDDYFSEEDNDDFVQQPEDAKHCLPFKVLGTCHNVARQRALEEAYTYPEEYNRPIFAKIEAEPDNPYDKQGIAVYVMLSSHFEKVGYLAKELTQCVHPVLSDKLLDVDVKKIRICTTYRMAGFYLTLNITKNGLWDKQVVSASKKVK